MGGVPFEYQSCPIINTGSTGTIDDWLERIAHTYCQQRGPGCPITLLKRLASLAIHLYLYFDDSVPTRNENEEL
jgi:hypothetical protein